MENLTKQNSSTGCFVCGINNNHSLKAKFYHIGNGTLIAEFNAMDQHQSYPGVLHGGIAAAILDETMGRTILSIDENLWGVTIDLNMKYRKPLPTGDKLYAKAFLTEHKNRSFTSAGAIILPDGTPAVTSTGKFMKLPLDKITQGGNFLEDWFYVEDERPVNLPEYIINFQL
ncbi:thioesterase superfamily protein [Denitrovibrio acetiphilus DSM 12809]|uniref:Acyl-coenzyme A thioesterase THEM4 n=1 Tax=Denitrovibrio acetiphilus (strain DSM 12809 / NBRC 114555 / N2460) TaxID=522772 RepID=D4H1F2_DENA2|nr:PaaI family thioesterase [Denitrovibrio acetiphilus]ADD66900.1 thioesterase superfamily protein [Denitrovibrio acetiphilus DSM 12809]